MVRVTCMRCGRGYSLTNDQIARAVEESRGTKHKYYMVNCPYCRQAAKVPLRPIRQAYTRLEALGVVTTAPTAEGEAAEPGEATPAAPAVEGQTEEQEEAGLAAPAPDSGTENKPTGE